MKKGQVYEGIVERVDFPGKGIVRVGEETAVVKLCLPGQRIRFVVNKARGGKAEGRLLEVLDASPLETGRPCSHFGLCGGCTYLSLPYEEQLKLKETQVKRLLDGVLTGRQGEWRFEGIKGSPAIYEYRNKMEFSFGDEYKGGPLALGMHRRGSFYDLVTVEDCRIVDAEYRLMLRTVREYFAKRGVRYFHRLSHEGYLRHLLVRKASRTGEILVALVTSSQSPTGSAQGKSLNNSSVDSTDGEVLVNGFAEALLALERQGLLKGSLAGILHIVNDSVADVVRSDRTELLYGKDYFYEELLGLRFKISVFSF
ncbi:MAG: 23S rRNA (uracil-5-)-methyltransferase RumA, partial [Butyrivibrio sp.]|nr:23S rRNA (uracil-5-)-methyltransferase RumA [Butyrivibrio sp.]